MKRGYLFLMVLLLLAACGREESENTQSEYSGARSAKAGAPSATPAIINLLAGVVQTAINSDQEAMPALLLGHAIPAGKTPFDLQRGTEYSYTFDKLHESILGFDLVHIRYKISYEAEMKYKGKGHYISNIRFTPILVETDPLFSVTAVAVSDAAVNVGTAKDPAASVRFTVSFSAKGIGSKNITDEFVINGKTGLMTSSLQKWD